MFAMPGGSFRYSHGAQIVPGSLISPPGISQPQHDYADFSLLKLEMERYQNLLLVQNLKIDMENFLTNRMPLDFFNNCVTLFAVEFKLDNSSDQLLL